MKCPQAKPKRANFSSLNEISLTSQTKARRDEKSLELAARNNLIPHQNNLHYLIINDPFTFSSFRTLSSCHHSFDLSHTHTHTFRDDVIKRENADESHPMTTKQEQSTNPHQIESEMLSDEKKNLRRSSTVETAKRKSFPKKKKKRRRRRKERQQKNLKLIHDSVGSDDDGGVKSENHKLSPKSLNTATRETIDEVSLVTESNFCCCLLPFQVNFD
jgi:hypothetical protein